MDVNNLIEQTKRMAEDARRIERLTEAAECARVLAEDYAETPAREMFNLNLDLVRGPEIGSVELERAAATIFEERWPEIRDEARRRIEAELADLRCRYGLTEVTP